MRDFRCDFFIHFAFETVENDENVLNVEQFELFNNEIVDANDVDVDSFDSSIFVS